MSDQIETKSAFSKPENWVTWGFTAALIYAAGVLLYNGLPYVNQIISNLWYTVAAGGSLAILLYVLASSDFHKLAWYGYKMAMRWITSRFIELDPIAIMRTYIEHYDNLLEEIKNAMGSIRAQLKNIQKSISDATDEANHSLKLASQAKSMIANNPDMQSKSVLEARKAERLQESVVKYQNMESMLNRYLEISRKMLDKANYNRSDLESTVDVKSKEREAIKATHKAMKGFKHLLQGDKELDMFNQALEAENNFEFEKIGEVEQFLEDSKDLMQSSDLENKVSELSSMAKLDEWEKKSSNVRISSSITPTPALLSNIDSSSSFDDLLGLDDGSTKVNNKVAKVSN